MRGRAIRKSDAELVDRSGPLLLHKWRERRGREGAGKKEEMRGKRRRRERRSGGKGRKEERRAAALLGVSVRLPPSLEKWKERERGAVAGEEGE